MTGAGAVAARTNALERRRSGRRTLRRVNSGRRVADRPSRQSAIVAMWCPYCYRRGVVVKALCEGHRAVKVQCPSCDREAFLAVPALSRASPPD